MELSLKYMIYMILVSEGLYKSSTKPIQDANIKIHEAEYQQHLETNLPVEAPRPQRQIVQPKWLTEGARPSTGVVDPNVHVTKESLKEAAIIRGQIQKAVEMGHFFDAASPTQLDPALEGAESPTPEPMPTPVPVPFEWPTQWSFQWPQFQSASNEPTPPFEAQQTPTPPNNLMEEWQRRWLEFWENSRRMFRWN